MRKTERFKTKVRVRYKIEAKNSELKMYLGMTADSIRHKLYVCKAL